MNNSAEKLRVLLRSYLAESVPSPDEIRAAAEHCRGLYKDVTDQEVEQIAREFEHIHGVRMEIGSALEDSGFEKWLEEARKDIDFYYWRRYKNLLVGKDFSSQVVATLDTVTDRILGVLEYPQKEGPWRRRGMVVGHVQSGKTANYSGLVCKAADAGYRVVIIIAGIHNNLRAQTQLRIDESFVGFASAGKGTRAADGGIIGVGKYDSRRRPSVFTNTLKDFNKNTATSVGIPLKNLREPAVFVIKKQTNTLRNLVEWLRSLNAQQGASSIAEPMLLIDDEADNASINISSGSDSVSTINGLIRELLAVFDRSCYVGYTATPFANIFVDPDSDDDMYGDDLFPSDFIVSLDPPDNYFGASRVFLSNEENGRGVIRHIEDNEDLLPLKHKIDHVVSGIPSSLETAVRAFVLVRAIRLVRGSSTPHNSMLVNASRFTSVQGALRNEIHMLVERIRESIKINGALGEHETPTDPEISKLHSVFETEFLGAGVEWHRVRAELLNSIGPITVVAVNSSSTDALDYEASARSGLNVIAVGGFSLSRGLTLEGLSVSYFLRNSMMYDTLMQMGRWFGYRSGYEDLCRVWMPEEAEGWYAHIAESIEELRDDLRQMESSNATPSQFGLRVRSHPDSLIVTARNKMGSGRPHPVSIGLANQFVETAILRRDEKSRSANISITERLTAELRSNGLEAECSSAFGSGHLFRSVPATLVMDFVGTFVNHESSFVTAPDPVRNYISNRAAGELANWDVFFPSIGKKAETAKTLICTRFGMKIACQRRKAGSRSDVDTLVVTEKQRVSSRGIERVGLSEESVAEAEAAYVERNGFNGSKTSVNFPDRIYRHVRSRPLLVVHLLAIGPEGQDLSATEPFVAWSISFPSTSLRDRTVAYVVNTTWWRDQFKDELEEIDAEGEEND